MAYIGNKPEVGNFRKCDAITTSATATYNLLVGGVAVNPNQNQCIVSLNGVIQSSGDSYTIASSQITFASTLASSDVIDFILILGDTLNVGTPSDDTISTAKIQTNAVTTAKILDGNVTGAKLNTDAISSQTALGVTPADTDEFMVSDAGVLKRVDYSYIKGITSSSFLPNAQPIIINGDMAVAQRSTSATGKTVSGYYSVDRVRNEFNVGTYTFAQESLTSGPAYEAGFRNAFRLDTTTAATPTAPDYVTMGYYFEGSQLSSFKFGGSDATKITLAFWVKSNKTGTGNVAMRNPDASLRQATHSYTISVADTWEHKILVFDGDTSAGFNDDNNQSMQLYWWLDGGSNFQVGSTSNGAWGVKNNSCFYAGADLDIAQNTANDWAFTGVQMLAGEYSASTLPPFQFDSYGDNLLKCQRYFYIRGGYSNYNYLSTATIGYNDTAHMAPIQFPVDMRTGPTFSYDGALSTFSLRDGTLTSHEPTSIAVDQPGPAITSISIAVSGGGLGSDTSGVLMGANSTACKIKFDAEM